jgi:hypothetical protein
MNTTTKLTQENKHNTQQPTATALHFSPSEQHRATNDTGSHAPQQFAKQTNTTGLNKNRETGATGAVLSDQDTHQGSHVDMCVPGHSNSDHVDLRQEVTHSRDEFLPPHLNIHPGANPPERMSGVNSCSMDAPSERGCRLALHIYMCTYTHEHTDT